MLAEQHEGAAKWRGRGGCFGRTGDRASHQTFRGTTEVCNHANEGRVPHPADMLTEQHGTEFLKPRNDKGRPMDALHRYHPRWALSAYSFFWPTA